MNILETYIARINDLRMDGLFGSEAPCIAEFVDKCSEEIQQHFLLGLSSLEQAERHIKIAMLKAESELQTAKPPSDENVRMSRCDKCGERYPSARPGNIHKCGKCSGGMCHPENPSNDIEQRGFPGTTF